MSARLIPTSQVHAEDPSWVSISNHSLAAIVAVAKAFDIPMEWGGCHDGQFLKPDSLERVALRIEQLNLFPGQLRWLAKQGGAVIY